MKDQKTGYKEVSFAVDDSFSIGQLDEKTSRIAALKIARIHQFETATAEDGQVYKTNAFSKDGKGDYRAEAYVKQGFSKPSKAGKKSYQLGDQYGVIKDGKLIAASKFGEPL